MDSNEKNIFAILKLVEEKQGKCFWRYALTQPYLTTSTIPLVRERRCGNTKVYFYTNHNVSKLISLFLEHFDLSNDKLRQKKMLPQEIAT